MSIFKKEISVVKIENIVLANGRVLIEKTEFNRVYKVLKVAKNCNYESLGKKIEIGDFVISDEYLYNNVFKLGGKDYYIIKPSSIVAFFQNGI